MKSTPASTDAEYQRIAEANRQFYASIAGLYEATECCVNSPETQKILNQDLGEVVALLKKPPQSVNALDACGGSGNIALKLLKMGVNVTLADISLELSRLYIAKCQQMGFEPKVVNGEIASILELPGPGFDLIVFSSALHHLQNIPFVLNLAFARLTPGGLLFTTFDPTSRKSHNLFTRFLLRAEYYVFKVFSQTSDLPGAFRRRLSRFLNKSCRDKSGTPLTNANLGYLAEYHVQTGIDDLGLAQRCLAMGYRIVKHSRYVDTRYRFTGFLIRRFTKDVTSFKLILQRPQ
jgi:ubiquinone/menaquinone biosynthesis C-methylase UbiE